MTTVVNSNCLSRRRVLAAGLASVAAPHAVLAAPAREITWDDLIPPGVPYSEIIGEGYMDEANDIWLPQFDENAKKFNQDLNGAHVKLPGFILPVDWSSAGVTSFVLVPYVGACIHTPPPPPNQLVYVTTKTPWPSEQLWDAVWVSGQMKTQLQTTELAQTGYAIAARKIETYVWF